MLIKPITVRLIAYGQKANVAAIRTRASAFLKDELGAVDASLLVAVSGMDVYAEIIATRWDTEIPIKKPTPSQAGICITLKEVHERLATEWLYELPIAKSCVAFAAWISPRDATAWQVLLLQGDHHSENRPLSGSA